MNTFKRLVIVSAGLALIAVSFSHRTPATYGQGPAGTTVYLPLVQRPDPCDELDTVVVEETDPRCPPRGSSSGVARGDFNNDGFADLAIGVPREDLTLSTGVVVPDAGGVNVIYGSSGGLAASAGPGDQFWSQQSSGVEDDPEPYDFFGTALASGDFNGDRYSDLAIGVSGEDLAHLNEAGAVSVLYGSPNGLTATNDQFWTQGISNAGRLLDTPEPGDGFGVALAWGNFNDDSYGDLAVGVRLEDLNIGGSNVVNVGAVNVIYGSTAGLSSTAGPGNQFWHQNSAGIDGSSEAGDLFGSALTGGDFNRDGIQDLVVGVPYEDVATTDRGTITNAGAVNVIYGSTAGLAAGAGPGDQIWDQTSIPNTPNENDRFGMAVVAADFSGDRYADLAIGAPTDYAAVWPQGGVVNVLYGGSGGLSTRGNQFLSQDVVGPGLEVADQSETGDRFGLTLAAGDINGDGIRDLAIGVPYEDYESTGLPSLPDAGGVNILFGSSNGLTGRAPFLRFGQGFGQALSMWDFNGDRIADLAIADEIEGGRVSILYGPLPANVGPEDYERWTQDSAGIEGEVEDGDAFGSALY